MHGIIRVKYLLFWVNFCSEHTIQCFAETSVFAAFYAFLVTHLVAYRLTLFNPLLAIPILYLLG